MALDLRLDSWENAITGLGTLRDKLRAHVPRMSSQLPDSALEALHTDDDICARIIEQLPGDALRAGFGVSLPADSMVDASSSAKQIEKLLNALGADAALREAWIWARLYGFGAVLLGVNDGLPLNEPLELGAVRSLSHLTVIRRPQLQQESYYEDIAAPNYGRVETYRISTPTLPRGSANRQTSTNKTIDYIVHESRLLAFRGAPTSRWGLQSASQWDDSVLQRVYQAVQASSSSWMSAAHLMTDASQGVLKINNFMQLLTSAGEEKLRQRIRLMDLGRSVCRSLLIDERETFERTPTPFTGVPELLDRFMMRVASAAETPVTVLFGRSPAGLNATGESDTRAWYDKVATERAQRLTPQIDKLVRCVMAIDGGPTKGVIVDEFEVTYPPLWQPTAKEKAETLKITSDALATLANARIIQPEEAALHLAKCGDLDELDVESREVALRYELERLANPEPEPEPNPEPEPPAVPPAPPAVPPRYDA